MTDDTIAIIDYGMGNLNSVFKKVHRFHKNVIITSNQMDILNADKLILPGVGHFQKAMENLSKLGLLDVLNENVLVKQKPILGICLGMQLFAKYSEEGDCNGLGWIDAEVIRFKVADTLKHKIPHIGWNGIIKTQESNLMTNIPDFAEFYFVHSFHLISACNEIIINNTEYDYSFISAIQKGNIYGVQYHPEKSHDVGAVLLENFINL